MRNDVREPSPPPDNGCITDRQGEGWRLPLREDRERRKGTLTFRLGKALQADVFQRLGATFDVAHRSVLLCRSVLLFLPN